MTTSLQTIALSELARGGPYSGTTLSFFAARHRNRQYDTILRKFRERAARDPQFTQASLARSIGVNASVLNRWMQNPTNWRTDTFSKLLIGICGEELTFETVDPLKRPPRNRHGSGTIRK